jgi:peptidoglycan L-alanyl-D-glutamate endopeptidase CwlK
MIASRKISDLHPKVATLCNLFVEDCDEVGIDVLVYRTYCDNEAQDQIYAIGRTVKGANVSVKKPMGDIVTNAKGGESFHNYRLAFDFVPLIHGKAMWGDKALYAKCGKIGEECGLTWSGRWTGKLKETAHMQYSNGLTISDLKAGKMI